MTTGISTSNSTRDRLRDWWRQHHRRFAAFQFIGPFLVLYLVFRIYPVLYALVLSFHEWKGLGPWNFVGFENYVATLTDPVAIRAFTNTVIMGGGQLLLGIPLALFLATILNSKATLGRGFFQTVYFIPRVVALAVTVIIFATLFQKDYGAINYVLGLFGVEGPPWLQHPWWAKIGITLIRVWVLTGFLMIYFLAGLQAIPDELYEAVEIDGGKAHHKFFHITLPLLRPVTLFVTIIGTVQAFNIFVIPYMLTSGGPSNATISIVQYMIQRGTTDLNFGFAATISIYLTLLLAVLAVLQFRLQGGGRRT